VAQIQFGIDNRTVVNDDIHDHVNKQNNTPDGVTHGVRVQDSSLHRTQFGLNAGTSTSNKTTSVQLMEASDKVKVLGNETDPTTAAYLQKVLPVAEEAQRVADEARAQEAQSEADIDKAAAIQNPIAQQIFDEMKGVGLQHKAAIIVSSMKGDINGAHVATQRLADVLQEDVGMVGAKVDILRETLSRQIQSVCASHGVDFAAFSSWADRFASDTAMTCLVNHIEAGSPAKAWGPLIRKFQGQ
jgi:hypothetical protein